MTSKSKTSFFNSYFERLESEGIDNVILHTYQDFPENIHSDVDYCVSDENLGRIISLVLEHCRSSGWRLVQIMQHEVKAFFCICVSIDEPTEYLELDVCSDYMREGKILIRAEKLLEGRRPIEGKSFHGPSHGMEFCYALWKSVAKRKAKDVMMRDLSVLYSENPEGCERCLKDMGVSHSWEKNAQEVYEKLESEYQEKALVSAQNRLSKLARRLVQPSGLLVLFSNKEKANECITSEYFLRSMKHCFRRVDEKINDVTLLEGFKKVLKSTLVLVDQSSLPAKLLAIKFKFLRGSLWIGRVSPEKTVSQIHEFLERRLIKRWKLPSGGVDTN